MLHEFLTANSDELIKRCSAKVALRRAPDVRDELLEYGVPLFIDQLARTLRLERSPQPLDRNQAGRSDISGSATKHGRELLQHGFSLDQVVHDYGDLCQAITELAAEFGKPIRIDEFRTLNRCLDDAIADAVTEYSFGSNVIVAEQGIVALDGRLGFLADELRNHVDTASVAFFNIRSGNVGLDSAAGQSLERSLTTLSSLIDRSLAEVRVMAGMSARKQRLSLAELMTEIAVSANLEAQARNCTLSISSVDPGLTIDADRHLLTSALNNLLRNAFRFTQSGTEVSISTYAAADRVLIEIADGCGGGLPMSAGEGVGLSISKRSVEANDGWLSVRDIPGFGCVFTIDLPRV